MERSASKIARRRARERKAKREVERRKRKSESERQDAELAVARKYLIETFGCQMNVHDSERMAGSSSRPDSRPTDEVARADVRRHQYLQRPGACRGKACIRASGELRELAANTGTTRLVAVAGCVAQQEGDAILKRSAGVADVIIGTQAIRRLPMLWSQQATAQRRRPVIDSSDPFDDVTFPPG